MFKIHAHSEMGALKLLSSDIKQYQRLSKKYFDKELNDSEARDQLTRLVRQLMVVYLPNAQGGVTR